MKTGPSPLDRATRTGVVFAAGPLRAQTYDGAFTAGDGVLEEIHEGELRVEYTDCNDGDSDPANDVKADTTTYNAPRWW